MKFEKSSTTYLIEVPLDQFEALLDYESPWGGDASEPLYVRLRNIGVESDYDSHYSSIISVDIHVDDDGSDFQSEITEVIKDQLEKASEWKKSETA